MLFVTFLPYRIQHRWTDVQRYLIHKIQMHDKYIKQAEIYTNAHLTEC